MISRVADHCFWLGRYVERAESTARMLWATGSLALDAELPAEQVWRPIVVVSGEEDEFQGNWGDGEMVQRFMVWDEDNGVSLASSIGGARWNARCIREVVSLEVWEAINELHLWNTSAESQQLYATQREAFYHHVRRATQLTLGLLRSTMLHDEPLDFIWLGVLLERVSQTARTLDVHHHAFTNLPPGMSGQFVETAVWLTLLRALGGSEGFMKRSAGRISSEAVARFLISDTGFPRSIAYCVQSAYARLSVIRPPDARDLPGGVSLERLRVLDTWVAARIKDPLPGASIHELLTHVVDEVHSICSALGKELLGAADSLVK